MLIEIDIKEGQDALDTASNITRQWKQGKVFHLKGRHFSSANEMRQFYDLMMESCGEPVEIGEAVQSEADRESASQQTGLRWTEIRNDPAIEDAYRHSSNPQPLHTDGSYIQSFPEAATLYCQKSAPNGGETIFVDSIDLLEALKAENPDLLNKLETNVFAHRRSGEEKIAKIIERSNGDVTLTWNYYCVSSKSTADQMAIKNDFFHYLAHSPIIKSKTVPVRLSPGECVIWKDTQVLHGRNGFDASQPSERFLWKSAFEMTKLVDG